VSDDLLELAENIAGRSDGNEALEAFVVHERSFEVKTYSGEVESVASAEPRGAGVRLVSGNRVGFAFTTDMTPDGLNQVVESARTNARYATEDEAAGLPDRPAQKAEALAGLVDPAQPDVSVEEKVAFALELERATREYEGVKAVEEAAYSDSDTQIAIATSTGISGSYRRTDAWCYSIAIAGSGDDQEMGFDFGLARGIGSLDAQAIAERSAHKALDVLGANKIPSARMPVVLDPYVAGQFLGVLSQALTGEAVQKGRSLFAGKIDQEVASSKVSLVDDGRLDGAPGSSPWDAEGVPTQRTEIILGGALKSFLYDSTSARREGRDSTGNASRAGFKSRPHPSATNLAFDPTGETASQILRDAGRALLVLDFHGVHSGANAVTGDFSVGATGRVLENGEPGAPVKEITVAAPMLDILKGIVAVGDDTRWLPFGGSYGGATTLVAEMTVGGV
jgi:PmbA protein